MSADRGIWYRQQDSPYIEGSWYVPYMKPNPLHSRKISRSINSVVLRWAGSEGKKEKEK